MSATTEWKLRWPNHCRGCNGWGGAAYTQNHGPGLNEPMFDVCDTCCASDTPTCGRCAASLTVEAVENGDACPGCGWRMDDGVPDEFDYGG